jgi:hypothetical protein
MSILIVGDKAGNFDKIKALGYEVIEVDLNGNEIKTNTATPITK